MSSFKLLDFFGHLQKDTDKNAIVLFYDHWESKTELDFISSSLKTTKI